MSDRSTENRVLAQLLMSIMEDPYYDSLRTKQQLGYLVFSGVKLVEGVSLIYLLVQSAERDPSYITDRSLEFLEGFRQELVDLPTSKLRCGDPRRCCILIGALSSATPEIRANLLERVWGLNVGVGRPRVVSGVLLCCVKRATTLP